MALVFVSAAHAHVNATAASITIAQPAGIAGDDVELAIIYGNDLTVDASLTGFETLLTTAPSTSGQVWVGQKRVTDAEPASYVFNLTASDFVVGAVLDYHGWPGWVIDAIDFAIGSDANVTAPSLNPTGSADRLICAFATFDGIAVTTAPGGYALRAQDIASGNQGMSVYDKSLTSPDPTGNPVEVIAASDDWLAVSIALREAPSGITRRRTFTASATVSLPAATPVGTGYEVNMRTREWLALATVTVAPAAQAGILPTYTPVYPTPVTIAGQPYLDSSKAPWEPTTDDVAALGQWGSPDIIINGKNVTTFRTDNDGNPVRTYITKWTDKSPGGDDLLDLVFPAISPRDVPGTGDLAWLKTDAQVTLRKRLPGSSTVLTVYEGVVGPVEDTLSGQSSSGAPPFTVTVHCLGMWSDLDRFITLPRPSIDQWVVPIPVGHLTPIDCAQFIYAHIHRAQLYGWTGHMSRPANTGILTGEQGGYGDPIASRTVQDTLAIMQKTGAFYTIVNARPRGLKLDTLVWGGGHFDFSLHCMQPGVTHALTKDPQTAFNAIFGHGQAPWGPVDNAIGRPDALADWMNWQYPIAAFDPPAYPLGPGVDFVAGDGHTGFLPFSTELRAHGYPLRSQDTYLAADFDLIEAFQGNSGAAVDGIVGPQTWLQAFEIGINTKALASAYIKEIVTSTNEAPFLVNSRGGIVGPNPLYDPVGHPRREVLEQFGSLSKHDAVKSAEEEWKRIQKPIYRGTVTATNVDPIEMPALDTRNGMTLDFKGHAGVDRKLFVAQVERVPGMNAGDIRTVTWTVSEQPEGLMTLAQRLLHAQGIKDLVASNRPPRHHAKEIASFPVFDAESGAGIVPPGQAQTGGLWQRFLVPMGGQVDVDAIKLVADRPAIMAAALFANPYLTIDQLADLIPNPGAGSIDHWAANVTALENLGICWSSGNPNGMQGYWPHDPGTTLTGVLYDNGGFPFRANATYGSLFVWTDRDCAVAGDPDAGYRAIFPNPVG